MALAVQCSATRPRLPVPWAAPRSVLPTAWTALRSLCGRGALQRPKLVPDDWQKVLELQAKGEVLSGTIKSVNRGGVVVEVAGQQGFVPYSRLAQTRLPKGAPGNGANLAFLVGQPISAKIIQVGKPTSLSGCRAWCSRDFCVRVFLNPPNVASLVGRPVNAEIFPGPSTPPPPSPRHIPEPWIRKALDLAPARCAWPARRSSAPSPGP